MKRMPALILAVGMMVALLAGCGGSGENTGNSISVNAQEVEPGLQIYADGEYLADRITIGCSGTGTSLAPQGKPVWGSVAVRDVIFQKLLRIGTDTELHLELLKELEQIDELTYKLTLWDCIYDTAGNHLTASDVVYSFDCYLATGNAGGISRLDHFEILNDYELLWHCKEPFAIGELGRQMSNVTVFTQAAMEASPDEMTTTPIGSGPYKLKSFTPGSACVMEADENFWMRSLPEETRNELWVYCYQNIKEIEYQVIKDASSRAIALEMGTIVATDAISEIDIEAFKDNPDVSPVEIVQAPPVPVIFNAGEDSACQDVNLRKAICYAIDNASLAAGIGDYTYQIYGFQPNLYDSPAEWLTGREYYDYNLETAKEYLEKSNYSGEALTLLYCGSTSAAYDAAAVLLQSQLEKAGITVTLLRVDSAVNEVLRFQGTEWDMRMDMVGGGDYMVQTYKYFYSGTYEAALGGKTTFLVEDETLDSLFEAWDADPENMERMTEYDDYFTYEQCYAYGVIGYNLLTACRSNVNVVLGDRGTYLVANAFTFHS